VRLVIGLPGRQLAIVGDDARWLVDELAAADEVIAARAREVVETGEPLRPSAAETRTLFAIFERSNRPRTRELRDLEVGLHEAIFRR